MSKSQVIQERVERRLAQPGRPLARGLIEGYVYLAVRDRHLAGEEMVEGGGEVWEHFRRVISARQPSWQVDTSS